MLAAPLAWRRRLHGLNAAHLGGIGWYRIDACGNKPGVSAQFHLPRKALAFSIKESQERDLPEIWAEPIAVIVGTLERYASYDQVLASLPDIALVSCPSSSAES